MSTGDSSFPIGPSVWMVLPVTLLSCAAGEPERGSAMSRPMKSAVLRTLPLMVLYEEPSVTITLVVNG